MKTESRIEIIFTLEEYQDYLIYKGKTHITAYKDPNVTGIMLNMSGTELIGFITWRANNSRST